MTNGDSTTQGSSAYGGITLGFIPPPAVGGLDSMGCHWQLVCQCIIGGTFSCADESTGGQARLRRINHPLHPHYEGHLQIPLCVLCDLCGWVSFPQEFNPEQLVPHTPANIAGMAPWARWMS